MKILMLSVVFPYPANDGGRSGIFRMIDALRNQHEITLICPESHEESSNELYTLWNNVKIINYKQAAFEKVSFKNRLKNVLGFHKKTKLETFKELTAINQSNLGGYFYNDFLPLVVNEIKNNEFDLIQVDFIELAGIVNFLPKNVKNVFVHHELRFKRMQMEYEALEIEDAAWQWKIENTKILELAILNLYDQIVVLTEIDKSILIKEGVVPQKISVSPLPIKVEERSSLNNIIFKNRLVFLGPEKHFPNLEGLDWFLKNCWEEILNQNADLQLDVVGSWSNEFIGYFNEYKNVNFLGFVDNLEKSLEPSIMIVPLRIGSGMRMKILEGVRYNTPIVSTTIGAEGLPMLDGENCFIADDANEFVEKIMKLMASKTLQESFVLNAKESIKQNYSIEYCVELRNEIYNKLN